VIINKVKRFSAMDNKLIELVIFPLICIVFILLHTNQSSSQTLASLLLMLTPLTLLLPRTEEAFEYKHLRLLFALVFTYFLYNFFILTQNTYSHLSLTSYRALFFWLLLPFTVIFLFNKKPTINSIALLFVIAAICSTYPIIADYQQNTRRGQSSMHAIFWGNISLCSAMIAFSLRKTFNNKSLKILSYVALIFGLMASFWSLTRGGWISIPLSLLCLYLCKSFTIKHLAAYSVILALLISLMPNVQERLLRTVKVNGSSWSNFSITLDGSTQARVDMWKMASALIKENPITGGGFSAYYDRAQELDHVQNYKMPHNEFIHSLVNGGIISLMLLLSVLVTLIIIFHGFRPGSHFKTAGYLLILQFSVFSISEIFFSTKLPIVYFCLASSFIIYAGLSEKHLNTTSS